MRPGTPHFVISSEDCLAIGGHFYSWKTLDKTMMAMVFERYVGTLTTNTAHSKCGIVFIRMLSYLTCVRNNHKTDDDGLWKPAEQELAHLIVITSYLSQLAPASFEDITEDIKTDSEDEGVEDEKERDERKAAAIARKAAFLERFEKDDPELFSFVEKERKLLLNRYNVDETWQNTDEFEHDFEYAVQALIPNLIDAVCRDTPTFLDDIVTAEHTLLMYSKEFHTQLLEVAEEGDEVQSQIHPSDALRDTIKAAREKYKIPTTLTFSRTPSLPRRTDEKFVTPPHLKNEGTKSAKDTVIGKAAKKFLVTSNVKRKNATEAGPSKVKRRKPE